MPSTSRLLRESPPPLGEDDQRRLSDCQEAALAFVNEVLVDRGFTPVIEMHAGTPMDTHACSLAETISTASDKRLHVTTKHNRTSVWEDKLPVGAGFHEYDHDERTFQFSVYFDLGFYPDLIDRERQ